MTRLIEFWHGRGGILLRRGIRGLLRVSAWVFATLVRQLRFLWASISPRTRIFAIIVGLVLISAWTSGSFPGLSEAAHGGAVLILALVGLWWIITAPFPSRRWW